jgi:hypothetical protein
VPLSTGALSNGWNYTPADVEEVCCDGVQKLEPLNCYKITMSEYRCLLGKVLDVVDASTANKQQHAAATRMVRKAFNAAYVHMLEFTFPESAFAQDSGVEPIR